MEDGAKLRASKHGLSQAEAQSRLKSEGFNELPRSGGRTPLKIVWDVMREPMFALLVGGGAIYLVLGDLKEALLLLAFATMSILITVVQETRTEKVLEALRDLTSPRAFVIRDGQYKRIAGREVVRGDLVVLSEGDRVPADARLLEARDLQVDESLLTGESVPVRKSISDGRSAALIVRPGGDYLPYAFSGSLVVRGSGLGEVIATGPRSEIGKIGQSLSKLESEPPRLQAQMRRLVHIFAVVGAGVSILAVVLYGVLRGGWLDAILAGIALGMSMLPEEFPVVLTVFMAMGAWRISQARVLTRRAAAIETLGSATVLCTDKTGTLTENRMTVVELRLADRDIWRRPASGTGEIPADFHLLAETGFLASATDPIDPMEKAFHELGQKIASRGTALRMVHAYGLRPDLLTMAQVWRQTNTEAEFIVAAKGAPEAIAELCHLPPESIERVKREVDAMAAEGLRILGVARAMHPGGGLPRSQREFAFKFLGLVGLADPVRKSVSAAIADCRSAGIRVIMITGDYPTTARAIAGKASLSVGDVFTGEDLEKLSAIELRERVRAATVFARIMPEQKLRIVNALKANGDIVCMTGDGVNDAPSLKAAHIGVAMGGRGTDVAREASSIVLLDDDFGSIVKAIRLGRRIYDNLRKAMGFIFAVHVPIAGLALLPLIFGLPILFGPVHIAFLEMVIDPVCSLVFEAETEEEAVMRRPPRAPDEPLFSRASIVWSLAQGALVLGLVGTIFVGAVARGMPDDEVRALAFFSLVLAILSLVFVNRSFSSSLVAAFRRPNIALAWVLAGVTAILTLSLVWAPLAGLLRFGPLHADDLTVTVSAGAAVLLVLEFLKPKFAKRMVS